ncbi:MAG: endo-1,4-beta-xylanase [Eubacteriales bacterium]|nr:endo-1,4-beta-xylanase [Eubacteriales bacterium]
MSDNRREVLRPFEEKRDYMQERIRNGIEENRKGFGTVRVQDAEGNPLPGARVTLKQKTHDFFHGANIFMLDELETEEKNQKYKDLFCGAFNMATVPFYWNGLEPEMGKPRFSADSPKIYRRPAPDRCVDFCEQHGITPKCHCLNYDQWTPMWVPQRASEVRRLLDKRMAEIAARYANRINGFEVTNETLCGFVEDSDRHSTEQFRDPETVEWSFKTARRHFPMNELIINEASGFMWEQFKDNRTGYYMQIERALSKGAPIDAIGMQYHMFFRKEEEQERTRVYYDPERFYGVLDRFADFGLPIQITEVTLPAYAETEEDEALQAEILRNVYSMWFSHGSVEAVIYWNLVDGYAHVSKDHPSWNENYYLGGLIRHDFTPKPAYRMLRNLFEKEWHTEVETTAGEGGVAKIHGFYGRYDLEVHAGDRSLCTEIHLSADAKRDVTVTL